jgi:ferric-dicitrate binding protein FerR (iron transport regulator)
MEIENEHIDQLILRFVEKTASKSEYDELLKWVEESTLHKEYFTMQCNLIYAAETSMKYGSDKAFSKIKNSIITKKPTKLKPLYFSIAGLSLIAIILYFLFHSTNNKPTINNEKSVPQTPTEYIGTDSIQDITFNNLNVTLNKNSRFVITPIDAEKSISKIYGNAVITASPSKNKNQDIEVGNISISADSAEYEVEEDSVSGKLTISVLSGNVKAKDLKTGKEYVCKKNNVYTITKDNCTNSVLPNLNTIAWKTKTLTFYNTPLSQAIPEIADFYSISIEFESNHLKACLLNAKLERYTIHEVTKMLEIAFGISVEQRNGVLYLSGAGCN